jgi:hypothetical protein
VSEQGGIVVLVTSDAGHHGCFDLDFKHVLRI